VKFRPTAAFTAEFIRFLSVSSVKSVVKSFSLGGAN
jgi:hypothetical protein